MVETVDAIVVGAGIVGAVTAATLAARGLKVRILEQGEPGGAVSGGSLACLGTHMMSATELPLLRWSCAAWAEFSAASPQKFEYEICGQIRFIDRVEDFCAAEHWLALEQAAGLSPKMLTPAELAAREPALTGPIQGATFSPDSATVNPFLAVRAWLASARAQGAVLHPRTPARGVATQAGRVTGVETSSGVFAAPRVILAAGPWSQELAASAGVNLALRPRRAQCLATTRQPPGTIRTVVGACESAGGVEAGYTQIQQSASGQILFNTVKAGGLAAPGAQDERREIDPDFVRQSIATLLRLFPGLASISLLRSWVRYEAVTPDDHFLAGPAGPAGLFVAAGDGGTGFVRAPGIARLVADLATGAIPLWDAAPYAPERFSGDQK